METAAELDTLQKDADDIRYWCSEKVEDLKVMERSESADCDEIAMWIETNNFDFNSWDNVVDQFTTSAQVSINISNGYCQSGRNGPI